MFLECFVDHCHCIVAFKLHVREAGLTWCQLLFNVDALCWILLVLLLLLEWILDQLLMIDSIVQLAIIIEFVLTIDFSAPSTED